MLISIPSESTNNEKRKVYLENNRKKYRYKYDYKNLSSVAMLDAEDLLPAALASGLFDIFNITADYHTVIEMIEKHLRFDDTHKLHKEAPRHGWWTGKNGFLNSVAKVVSNKIANEKIIAAIRKLKNKWQLNNMPLHEYKERFTSIALPEIANYGFNVDGTLKDEIFSEMRVSGPNPVMLELVMSEHDLSFKDDIQKYIIQLDKNDSLQAAITDARMYQVNYESKEINFNILTSNLKKDRYLWAPIAYFVKPKDSNSIVPIGIVYQSNAQRVFATPNDGINWAIAKVVVQIADATMHELISHLAYTHLVMEAILVATERQLHYTHPIYLLLRPHFEGTAFINAAAEATLVVKKGGVDELLSSTIENIQKFVAEGLQRYNFNDAMLLTDLKKRGISLSQLRDGSFHYPYADDSIQIWDAIHTWVTDYISFFYNDETVRNDHELQSWVKELNSGGKINGIGDDPSIVGINSVNYLIKMLTHIIFTASAQHAAVNYPQKSTMTFVPAMPLAGFNDLKAINSNNLETYWQLLPPSGRTDTQIGVGYLLGSVYHTRLGNYDDWKYNNGEEVKGKTLFGLIEGIQDLKAAYWKFKGTLDSIAGSINYKNQRRKVPYTTLLPDNIPQSVNV